MKTMRPRFVALAAAAALFGGVVVGVLADCGPFTDVGGGPPNFCPFILELYYVGITAGTSPTTFSPNDPVTRGQMAVFIAKSLDQSLQRGRRRAALGQWWTPQEAYALSFTAVDANPQQAASDGADIWVPHAFPSDSVWRVRASDGKPLGVWTGASRAMSVAVGMGGVFVSGNTDPGRLYRIDPTGAPGAVETVADSLGAFPEGLVFDGRRFWTANNNSVSIITPGGPTPWPATTVAGFVSLDGILYDGAHVWVSDSTGFKQLDSAGAVLQTIVMGNAGKPVFDGVNIWVPDNNDIRVIRASTGAEITTLVGNGLDFATAAAFDGERILVANRDGATVSLWKAADLTPLGSFPTGTGSSPTAVCSDGIHFWITLDGTDQLARF